VETKIIFLTLAAIKQYVVKIQYDEEKLHTLSYISNKHELYIDWKMKGLKNIQSSNMAVVIGQQFAQYFKNPYFVWSLPFDISYASDFRQRVWRQMQQIKSGHTATYGEIATELNSSPRAVANACRSNPLAIIIPCHRVVAKDNLGGYDGEGYCEQGEKILIKKYLLQHEQVKL